MCDGGCDAAQYGGADGSATVRSEHNEASVKVARRIQNCLPRRDTLPGFPGGVKSGSSSELGTLIGGRLGRLFDVRHPIAWHPRGRCAPKRNHSEWRIDRDDDCLPRCPELGGGLVYSLLCSLRAVIGDEDRFVVARHRLEHYSPALRCIA